MTSRRHLGATLIALFCVASSVVDPSRAHAQTASAVYSDVKDVFVQLIELRAAEDATRFVGRASRGLGYYLERSLEHVRRSQWGALQGSLRDDFADLGADYALWALRNRDNPSLRAHLTRGASFRAFLDCFEPPDLANQRLGSACAPLRNLVTGVPRVGRSTMRYQQCEAIAPERVQGNELSCEISQLVHASLIDDADEAHLYSNRILSAVGSFLSPTFRDHGPRLHAPIRTLIQDVLEVPAASDAVPKSWPLAVPPNRALHDALADCRGDARSLADLVRAAGTERAATDSISAAAVCLNARVPIPVKVVAVKPSGRSEVPKAIEAMVKLQRDARTFDALNALVKDGPAEAIELLGLRCTATTQCRDPKVRDPKDRDKAEVKDALSAAIALDDLSGRVFPASATSERFECSGTCPFEAIDVAADFATLRDDEAPPLPERTLTDVAREFAHGLRIITARIEDLCKNHRARYPELCRGAPDADPVVLELARYLLPNPDWPEARSDVQEVVDDAVRGRRAELASRALRAAFDELFETGAAGHVDRLFADLIVTVTQFELSDPSSDSRTVSRDALRASAIRLIDGLASETGYQSRGMTLRPIVSLRVSWNQGYRNERGSDGLRYIPSVDWPAVRTRISDAAVLQFSLFDLLAPLDEIAARDVPDDTLNTATGEAEYEFDYDGQEFLLLDAVRPRLNLLLGYPSLSRNLVLSAGASFRTITTRQFAESGGRFRRYRTTFGAKEDLADALEINLGVSYVF